MKFNNKKLSDESIKTYTNVINNLHKYLSDNKLKFTLNNIKTFLLTIDNASTFNINFSAIKSYLLELYTNKPSKQIELRNFIDSVKWNRPDKQLNETEYLTEEQVSKLILHADKKIGYFILALFQTGCRISELINIQLKHCKTKQDYTFILVKGKKSRQRTVGIKTKLYTSIRREFNGIKYLFETIHGNKYTRGYVSRKIKSIAEEIGYDNISAHTLRHSKAMYLKKEGLSIHGVSKALGHASASTTLEYYYHDTPTLDDQLKNLKD